LGNASEYSFNYPSVKPYNQCGSICAGTTAEERGRGTTAVTQVRKKSNETGWLARYSFRRTSVTAYKECKTAKLVVNVYSDYYVYYLYYSYRPVNVSAVKVCPDWNG